MNSHKKPHKRTMSAKARKRISDARRKRCAILRASTGRIPLQGTMSPEKRAHISYAQNLRWARYREKIKKRRKLIVLLFCMSQAQRLRWAKWRKSKGVHNA